MLYKHVLVLLPDLMFQGAFFNHTTPGILYAAHHHKGMRVYLFNFCIQLIQFQPGNNGIYDINLPPFRHGGQNPFALYTR